MQIHDGEGGTGDFRNSYKHNFGGRPDGNAPGARTLERRRWPSLTIMLDVVTRNPDTATGNPSALALLAATAAVVGCGWATLEYESRVDRRTLTAGEAELDRLALPSDWFETRSDSKRQAGTYEWSRTYQTVARGDGYILRVFGQEAASAGFHEVPDASGSGDGGGIFEKGRYKLSVSVLDECPGEPSVPATQVTSSASASPDVEPSCVGIGIYMHRDA